MSLPAVSITLANGLLGQVASSDDGVAALLCSGAAPGNLALATPVMITSLDQAVDQYAISTSSNFYRHIKAFYSEAGEGAKLYIMIVVNTTAMKDMCDKTKAFATKLLTYGAGKIRIMAVAKEPDAEYEPTVSKGIDQDILDALTNAEALGEAQQAVYQPVRFLLEGSDFNDTIADLDDLTAKSCNHAGIVLGSETSGGRGCVGLALGRAAKIPVQRNIGRVKDGPLAGIDAAYLGTKTVDSDLTVGDLGSVNDLGYIFMRAYTGRDGYFFNDDRMAALATDDFNSLARGRVIDKAIVISYQTYVDELLDDVIVDADGKLPASQVKYLQTRITNAINTAMSGEISAFTAFIDPDQNIVSTGKLTIVESIVPVGYNKQIAIKLGFATSAS